MANEISNGAAVVVSGKTYGYREILKSAGLRWDPASKTWGGTLDAWTVTPEGRVEALALTQIRSGIASGELTLGAWCSAAASYRWYTNTRHGRELSRDC